MMAPIFDSVDNFAIPTAGLNGKIDGDSILTEDVTDSCSEDDSDNERSIRLQARKPLKDITGDVANIRDRELNLLDEDDIQDVTEWSSGPMLNFLTQGREPRFNPSFAISKEPSTP